LRLENKDAMRRLIHELDERSRVAVVLRYFAEMSYEEIGQVLGLSTNFVGVLLLRARRTMRKRLPTL
jgi:RNA polymerase sigma factor (sigma-70 family)